MKMAVMILLKFQYFMETVSLNISVGGVIIKIMVCALGVQARNDVDLYF
jgi:hypothetical protein